MSDDNGSDTNVRRSRRIAAKADEPPKQLMDILIDDLEHDDSPASSTSTGTTTKKTTANQAKKKVYRSTGKSKSEATGTLFDQGLKAVSIIGTTSINDEAKGTEDICYLVKYDNGQFELVLNTVAHKFCPLLVIEYLESRIIFRETKDDFALPPELFSDSSQLDSLSDIPDSQLAQLGDHSNRSLEI